MNILLVESFWEHTGHTRGWFLGILRSLAENEHAVHAFCPAVAAVESAVGSWPEELSSRVRFIGGVPDLSGPVSRLRRLSVGPVHRMAQWIRLWRVLRRYSQRPGGDPDLVLIPFLDPFCISASPIAWIMNRFVFAPWMGFYFWLDEREFQRRSKASLRLWSSLAISRSESCRGLCVFTESAGRTLAGLGSGRHWVLPDFADAVLPSERSPLGRKVLERAAGRQVVLCCGHLTPRKGLIEFLDLADACEREDWLFVVAGSLELSSFSPAEQERIGSILADPPGNQFWYPERVPTEELFNELIDLAAVCFAVYRDYPFSANILAKAASFNTPVLVAEGFEMGDRVREYGIGRSVPQADIGAMEEAIRKILTGPSITSANFRAYVDKHNIDQFNGALEAAIQSTSPAYPSTRTTDDQRHNPSL